MTASRHLYLKSVGIIVAFTAAVAWPWACGGPAPSPDRSADSRTVTIDSHGLHVVRDARLREIMRKLNGMDFDAMAVELEATGGLLRDVCEVSELAVALAGDAQVIPLIFEDPNMTEESRRVMNRLSARLRLQAIEVRDAAEDNDLYQVKTRLEAMLKTCNECHASFRAPAVALGVGEPGDGKPRAPHAAAL